MANNDALTYSVDEMDRLAKLLKQEADAIEQSRLAYEKVVHATYAVWSGPAQQRHEEANNRLNQVIADIRDTVDAFYLATSKASGHLSDAEQSNQSLFNI